MATSTVENYLKQLYLEQLPYTGELVPMGRLASVMGVVPGTATSMVKALADAGLVVYAPRGGVRLTDSGQQLALHVLRRHRLIELFLVKVLGLDWAEVHDEAETLEHAVSDRVLERIDALLGNPAVDPHGDPIPTAKGHLPPNAAHSLADCPTALPQHITRILNQDRDFLQFVERHGLIPGAAVTVRGREEASNAVNIEVAGAKTVALGSAAAAMILVEGKRSRKTAPKARKVRP